MAICDDEASALEHTRLLAQAWAEQAGHAARIETFLTAEAFLIQYEEDKAFDLLLLDIEMARMNGVALARTVRAQNREIAIVFLTGYADYIADGYDVEALHYLLKPITREKLFPVL
ncbi:MAG: response regulator, partial [Clostridiales bacterium]|nr:response regulator [Clostridiales bacterium]